ncbi:4Fe-4S dicluster domain-containing protein [Mangrovitalea sediminis]|uniref:4Fe-4S dicluster domain-containing protein n=1 Tax=Mangrovitalea sediminis TaxID=1982043 RepID=UPI000BE56ACA|nr:4Fe-4S dicluster domain-containing protein [Mangrovitalea sediminis]
MADAVPGFLPRAALQHLIDALIAAGYRCLGPQERDGAILYDRLTSVTQLPLGRHDRQAPGHYRLEASADPRWFAWANGPQALKPLLFAPTEPLWKVTREADGVMHFSEQAVPAEPTAVIGVRACDLAALALQDAHFMAPPHADAHYMARRANLFLVAVNCTHPADTCFCVSTGDGPNATTGYDIDLSELEDGFLIQAGSDEGRQILASLPLVPASTRQIALAQSQTDKAIAAQSRSLPGHNLRAALFANLEHPRWQEVADRCLSCGNCTSVCPTCFCSSHNEVPDLSGTSSEHVREWSSCFTLDHSYMHGYVVRPDTRTRYRQWLTHKLGSWHEQYGRSGCVGCGRCVSWCPAGIDITEEATAICGGGQHD